MGIVKANTHIIQRRWGGDFIKGKRAIRNRRNNQAGFIMLWFIFHLKRSNRDECDAAYQLKIFY